VVRFKFLSVGPASVDTLLARVRADVPAGKHTIARRSLTAHLLKLASEGRAREAEGAWSLAQGRRGNNARSRATRKPDTLSACIAGLFCASHDLAGGTRRAPLTR